MVNTKVAVRGESVMSRKTGTVMIRSLDHKHIIHCKDVLYIPECEKKLLPAYQFIRKGCTLTFADNKVRMSNKDRQPMFDGMEIGGLYFFRAETVRNQSCKKMKANTQEVAAASTFFGLKASDKLNSTSQDFTNRLLEAHWSYGHLNFNKLRKLLGLQSGTNPECPACTLAASRKQALADSTYTRSTRACHRMHMDVGFTQDKQYVFQLYVDDYTRETNLDVIDSKDQVLDQWIALKDHLEKAHYPSKFAFVKTDSEPLYQTAAWVEHCKDNNLDHEFSSRYRHDQLGVAERAMQTIGIAFRAMMF